MRTGYSLLGLLLAAVLSACGGDDGAGGSAAATQAAAPSLDGTTWAMTRVAGTAA